MPKPLIVLPYSILIGLTPLIPVPFLDDWVASLLVRRMVADLGAAYGMKLSPAEIDRLAAGESAGCLGGCLSSLLIYPLIKRILREVFFVFEWQRAINFVSHSYYYAFLLDAVFENGWYTPRSLARAAQVNAAIHRVRQRANTNLVKRVVETHFNNSKAAVIGTARWIFAQWRKISFRGFKQRIQAVGLALRRPFRRSKKAMPDPQPPAPSESSVSGSPASVEAGNPAKKGLRAWFSRRRKEKPREDAPPPKPKRPLDELLRMEILWLKVGELAVKIQDDITTLPREHFDDLKQRLKNELIPPTIDMPDSEKTQPTRRG